MPRCEIVVCLPTYPFTLELLTPHYEASVLANRLRSNGSNVVIHDFSTLQTVDRFFALGSKTLFPNGAEEAGAADLSSRVQRTKRRRLARVRLSNIVRQLIVETFSREPLPNTRVWFYAATADEFAMCHEAASILASLRPEATVRFCGPYGSRLDGSRPADNIDCGDSTPPNPAYELDMDARQGEHSKVMVFTLPDRTSPSSSFWHARLLADRVAALQSRHRAAGFHFIAAGPAAAAPETLCREILARRLRVLYSREAHPGDTPSRAFAALRLSGCTAIEYCVRSGSQRLLDEHYRHPISVSRTEGQLRASAFSGIFTVAHFTYPCPEDDYHTQAETLRLIERSRPNAVKVGLMPGVPPSVRQLRDKSRLLALIEELGISTAVSAKMALMAALAGHAGQEAEFARDVERRFETCDMAGLTSIVDRINAPQRAAAMGACPPFAADLSAVVN